MRTPARPNILLIMADQHRGDVLGCAQPETGAPWPVQTPNLDRLAREGVRFRRGYTESPVCVSARSILLTGRLPHRTGVVDNGYSVRPGTVTLPVLLASRGYHARVSSLAGLPRAGDRQDALHAGARTPRARVA